MVVLWENCSMLKTCRKWDIVWRKILPASRTPRYLNTEVQVMKMVTWLWLLPSAKLPHHFVTGAETQVSTGFSLQLGLVCYRESFSLSLIILKYTPKLLHRSVSSNFSWNKPVLKSTPVNILFHKNLTPKPCMCKTWLPSNLVQSLLKG